jgi:hypothetical protein
MCKAHGDRPIGLPEDDHVTGDRCSREARAAAQHAVEMCCGG